MDPAPSETSDTDRVSAVACVLGEPSPEIVGAAQDAGWSIVQHSDAPDLLIVAALPSARLATNAAIRLAIVAPGEIGSLDRWRAAGATHVLIDRSDRAEAVALFRFLLPCPREMPEFDRGARAGIAWLDTVIASGRPSGAIIAAVSRLDIVNAAHGRPAGDRLIAEAERRITRTASQALPDHALVERVGASEFLVCADASGSGLADAAARISEVLAQPFPVDGALAVFGSRIGTAERQANDDAIAVIARAREAFGRARAGDGVIIRAAPVGSPAPTDRLAIDLHHALDRGEIDVLFQPQVAIARGLIIGVEALARWEHAELGVLGADALFAAAERADLSVALSEHIQELVLMRAASWGRPANELRVSLNVTAAELTRRDFAANFLNRVDASGFPRGRLTVEITESGMMDDLAAAALVFAELRGAGCRIAIDDFGTGYSSLAYLKALPLDYLKIDKRLAGDITGSDRDRIVVTGVVEMARSLGLSVIVEGVETEEQRTRLAAAGCDIYQGFLCAEPLSEADLFKRIVRRA